ncbi:MAG: acyl carrier protein [Bacteroidia bacterium]
MRDRILEILIGIRPDIDFENETALMDDGHLDSFDIVSIISDLNDEYNIHIRITELKPENFNSVDALVALVQKLQNS